VVAGEPLRSVDAPTPLLLRSPPLAKEGPKSYIATTHLASGKSLRVRRVDAIYM